MQHWIYIFVHSEFPKTPIRNLTASLQGGGVVQAGFPSNSIALLINHKWHFDATFLTAYGLMGELLLVENSGSFAAVVGTL